MVVKAIEALVIALVIALLLLMIVNTALDIAVSLHALQVIEEIRDGRPRGIVGPNRREPIGGQHGTARKA
jgi:hypothetical protein